MPGTRDTFCVDHILAVNVELLGDGARRLIVSKSGVDNPLFLGLVNLEPVWRKRHRVLITHTAVSVPTHAMLH